MRRLIGIAAAIGALVAAEPAAATFIEAHVSVQGAGRILTDTFPATLCNRDDNTDDRVTVACGRAVAADPDDGSNPPVTLVLTAVPRSGAGAHTFRRWEGCDGLATSNRCVLTAAPGNNRTVSPKAVFEQDRTPVPTVGTPPAAPAPPPSAPVPAPASAPATAESVAAPHPRLRVSLAYEFVTRGRVTTLTKLQVKDVPSGARVSATCDKCPSTARRPYTVSRAGTVRLRRYERVRLKAGTRITVVVARPGLVGAVKVLELRGSKPPALKDRCLPEGARRPQPCRRD